MTGMVYLVGAGPGDAELLTLRAARLLREADIILHDALVGPDVLALARPERLWNIGKRADRPSPDQAFISRLLVRMAQRHKVVVRLKGGDPLLFARAEEELRACRAAGVAVEVVPGVTAGFAAAADLLTPLTRRETARSVVFVTPSRTQNGAADEHWAFAAAAADSAVIYMGRSQAERVRQSLAAQGLSLDTPTVLVESASLPHRCAIGGRLADLPILADATGDGPTLVLIGEAFRAAALEHAMPDRRTVRA
jgi:uroporphyrin-III C-methyltransferase